MKGVELNKKLLLILLSVIFISGLYLFIDRVFDISTSEITITQQSTPSPITISSDEKILSEISKGFSEKYGKPVDNFILTLDKKNETHAKGSVRIKDEAGGGLWFGAKVANSWKLVFDGNGIISCEVADKYSFSKDIISGCVDLKDDKFIERGSD